VARLGAVASGLNTRLGPREVSAIFNRATPALVVIDDGVTLPSGSPRMSVVGRGELARACGGPPLGARRPKGRREDPVVIIWTSGTTGTPKGAWFDHDNLRAAVTSAGVMTAPFDRRLSATPFAHAGYMAKLWEQLAWGITLVLTPTPWTATDTVRLLVDERISTAGAVPTQWAKIVDEPGLEGADLSHLRLCVSATAPASPELVERVAARLGCPVVVRYAMTECPSITGTEPDDPPITQYRTVGRPQAGVAVALRDETGAAVPDGAVGRVLVRSTCVMRGYWGDPELTSAAFSADGWLRSGDLARWDAAGNLVLCGRADDMYIRGGYNVYPLEVEHVLAEHPGVDDVGVIGVTAPVIGEIGVAFVVPATGAPAPSIEELRSWCHERLADYKAPDEVVVVDELPRTAMMKVDKAALRLRVNP
jgi:acyl-CoA synthetase (AMP-forming)/AMP-acid ligase II